MEQPHQPGDRQKEGTQNIVYESHKTVIYAQNVNTNNNININNGGQPINNNNNNNGGQSTNNNINTAKNKRKFNELEDQERIEDSVQPIEMPTADAQETRVKLLAPELVGQTSKTKNEEIWSLLMKDEVTSIGVWGMGGVGKTTLMMNIQNQLLERPNNFEHVYWLTVSQDFNIYKLQNHIAKTIKYDLSEEDDEKIRAAELSNVLKGKKKIVLILDDLWDYFDANGVGIPVGINGCKMIFTTRSLDVCRQMRVKNIIKVEALLEEEAWLLFTKELGSYNTELEHFAKAIAGECAGLPLGLKTMARSMRGVDDISEWKNALDELKGAEKGEDMGSEVFQVLRYSYDRLNDLTAQECFLTCALFPEDSQIEREMLIEYLIVEGIIEGHNKGHAILNKLENACLLEGCRNYENDRCVKMHDLIRDTALQELRERPSTMVNVCAQLREIPGVNEWTDSLVRVSLVKNCIEEIPLGHSPRCPKLSTLFLTSNSELRLIAYSFFKHLHSLKVLDLSDTRIEQLPDSTSELVSLVILLLRGCSNLWYIPSLAKLTELQKLDLSCTGLEKLPNGMECLANLRYLALGESDIKEITAGILPNLPHLQVLKLIDYTGFFIRTTLAPAKEVAGLRKLISLKCHFESFSDFRECMEHLNLDTYGIVIGEYEMCPYDRDLDISKQGVYLYGCCISTEQDFKAFPKDIKALVMYKCKLPGISLFGDSSLSLRRIMKVKDIWIDDCDGIKSLVSLPSTSSDIFKCLETLSLWELKSFRVVISRRTPLQSISLFACLKKFSIYRCDGVKRLFPIGLLSTLQNLETLIVSRCHRMEEIEATEEEEGHLDDDDDNHEEENEDDYEEEERRKVEQNNNSSRYLSDESIKLPKLKRLELHFLPKLRSICSGLMICYSLQEIKIYECPKLKGMPLYYQQVCRRIIIPSSKKWREVVQWDEHAKKNCIQLILY